MHVNLLHLVGLVRGKSIVVGVCNLLSPTCQNLMPYCMLTHLRTASAVPDMTTRRRRPIGPSRPLPSNVHNTPTFASSHEVRNHRYTASLAVRAPPPPVATLPLRGQPPPIAHTLYCSFVRPLTSLPQADRFRLGYFAALRLPPRPPTSCASDILHAHHIPCCPRHPHPQWLVRCTGTLSPPFGPTSCASDILPANSLKIWAMGLRTTLASTLSRPEGSTTRACQYCPKATLRYHANLPCLSLNHLASHVGKHVELAWGQRGNARKDITREI